VKKSAVAKGVRSQSEVDRLNDTEVYLLLFEAGFSTAAEADEFKGRGVGLDVVKTCLDEIRGVIIVESAVGKGTTFTIR
jgi:chemotaxis protein histidine kinase CheA